MHLGLQCSIESLQTGHLLTGSLADFQQKVQHAHTERDRMTYDKNDLPDSLPPVAIWKRRGYKSGQSVLVFALSLVVDDNVGLGRDSLILDHLEPLPQKKRLCVTVFVVHFCIHSSSATL
jgi:hypothetical protein